MIAGKRSPATRNALTAPLASPAPITAGSAQISPAVRPPERMRERKAAKVMMPGKERSIWPLPLAITSIWPRATRVRKAADTPTPARLARLKEAVPALRASQRRSEPAAAHPQAGQRHAGRARESLPLIAVPPR